MEREGRGRGENFVNKKRLNIVARSVAAISIAAAGAVAVEKSGSFDTLSAPANSASHLVLNNLHNSFEQLIDKLPEVEKAEAVTTQKTFNFVNNTGFGQGYLYIDFDDVAHRLNGDGSCSSVSGDYWDDKWNCTIPAITPYCS